MKLFRTLPIAVCLAFLGATFSPAAKADDWDKKTRITFSGPVEIPGVHLEGWGVLPAGTYVFKLLDSRSDRHIVQIFSEDELTVYATILAIPNYRLKATDKTVITFNERPLGQPEALRAWFYPGRNWGDEFVYPKAKAIELAKTTQTPVLFAAVELPVEVPAPVKLTEAPMVAALVQAPVLAIKPTGEEVVLAEVVTPPPAQAAEVAAAAPASTILSRLPDTASNVPLVALFGLLALVGAGIIAFLRRRVV